MWIAGVVYCKWVDYSERLARKLVIFPWTSPPPKKKRWSYLETILKVAILLVDNSGVFLLWAVFTVSHWSVDGLKKISCSCFEVFWVGRPPKKTRCSHFKRPNGPNSLGSLKMYPKNICLLGPHAGLGLFYYFFNILDDQILKSWSLVDNVWIIWFESILDSEYPMRLNMLGIFITEYHFLGIISSWLWYDVPSIFYPAGRRLKWPNIHDCYGF